MGANTARAARLAGYSALAVVLGGASDGVAGDCSGASLRVRMLDAVGLEADVRDAAAAEIAAAWPAAVCVLPTETRAPEDEATTLYVLLRTVLPTRAGVRCSYGRCAKGNSHGVLAWVPFVGDQPGTTVFVSIAELRRVVDTFTFAGRPTRECTARLHRALLGRALGRVLAHEIGHYLRGQAHARTGLMKPALSQEDLLGERAPAP